MFFDNDMLTLPLAILMVDSLPFVEALLFDLPSRSLPDRDDGCESLDTDEGRFSIDFIGAGCCGVAGIISLDICESAVDVRTNSLLGLVSAQLLSFSEEDEPAAGIGSDLRCARGGRTGDLSTVCDERTLLVLFELPLFSLLT